MKIACYFHWLQKWRTSLSFLQCCCWRSVEVANGWLVGTYVSFLYLCFDTSVSISIIMKHKLMGLSRLLQVVGWAWTVCQNVRDIPLIILVTIPKIKNMCLLSMLKLITRCVHHQSESPRAPVSPPAVGLTLFPVSRSMTSYTASLPTFLSPTARSWLVGVFYQQETAAVGPTAEPCSRPPAVGLPAADQIGTRWEPTSSQKTVPWTQLLPTAADIWYMFGALVTINGLSKNHRWKYYPVFKLNKYYISRHHNTTGS